VRKKTALCWQHSQDKYSPQRLQDTKGQKSTGNNSSQISAFGLCGLPGKSEMKKIFWITLQTVALFLLLGSLPLGYLIKHPVTGWVLFLAIVLLHVGELLVTIPLAKQRNLLIGITILKTMLFGFTWWVPFKHGLLQG
jgi:hypothetical protein